jgi:hypothetical protein
MIAPGEVNDRQEELMKKKKVLRALGLGVLVGSLFTGFTLPAMGQQGYSDKIILGETAVVGGNELSTWARVNDAGQVVWVGLTIPLALVENMPAGGSGPSGAIAVLNYPTVVKETTYFDHAEIHSEPDGHPTNPGYADTNRYGVAHFDFHFYSVPVSQVLTIPFGFFFDEVPADQLPRFYAQPEAISIPQMGRHDAPISEFTATDHWLATMLAGFLPDASSMHFLEPMVTQELLLQRKSFSMRVPRPATLGRATRYPAECVFHYENSVDSYQIVFIGFQPIQ